MIFQVHYSPFCFPEPCAKMIWVYVINRWKGKKSTSFEVLHYQKWWWEMVIQTASNHVQKCWKQHFLNWKYLQTILPICCKFSKIRNFPEMIYDVFVKQSLCWITLAGFIQSLAECCGGRNLFQIENGLEQRVIAIQINIGKIAFAVCQQSHSHVDNAAVRKFSVFCFFDVVKCSIFSSPIPEICVPIKIFPFFELTFSLPCVILAIESPAGYLVFFRFGLS